MHASFGSVSAVGEIENPGSGDWRVVKGPAGTYAIAVDTGSEARPVVVVRGSVTGDDLASDNVVSVSVESESRFTVTSRDVAGWRENELQGAAFSFLALWP